MSVFDKIRNRNRASSETFAFRVEEYGTDPDRGIEYVAGTRIDTDEFVKVFLRDLPEDTRKRMKQEFQRPEVADIKKKVKKGGILRAESCFKQRDMYSARWLGVIAKKPDIGDAVRLPTRIFPVVTNEENNKKFQSAEFLVPDGKKEVTDAESFDTLLAEALQMDAVRKVGLPENTVPIAVIRLESVDNPDDLYHIVVRARRVQEEDGTWRTALGEEALTHLSDTQKETIEQIKEEFIGAEGVKTTIVPGGRLNIGPMTIHDKLAQPYAVPFRVKDENGEIHEKHAYMFRDSVVGLRKVETEEDEQDDVAMIVISATPVSFNAPMTRDGITWHSKQDWERILTQSAGVEPSADASLSDDKIAESKAAETLEDEDFEDLLEDDAVPDFGDDVDSLDDLDADELAEMVNTARKRSGKEKSLAM